MGWQLGVYESVLKEILNGTQVRHLDVFMHFLISHSNAHLSYTRNDKHRLMYKLMYISCLLTVTAQSITY